MKVFCFGKRHLVSLLLPAMLLLSTIYAQDVIQPLSGKVIIVDAGHGGIDSGANRHGIAEKDVNLAVTLFLKDVLNQYGAKVVLSRQTDVDLSGECDNAKVKGRYHRDLAARIELVEESDADLFISIHANAVTNSNRHGAEVFYYRKSPVSKALADMIQTELCNVSQVQRTAAPADYFVLRRNKIPAALIEVGYITNMDERRLLLSSDYQKKLANAIAAGIVNYYR